MLERLAKQICRIAGVEISCIFVRDRRDPRLVISAAGHGLPWELLGSRFGADEGPVGDVLASGAPMLTEDFNELIAPLEVPAAAGCAGAAVPVHVNGRVDGVLMAGCCSADRTFGDEELLLLSELADLAAAALEHSEERRQFDDLMKAHVEALAAAMDMRDRRTAAHSEDVVRLACAVGRLLGLEAASLVELEFAARLHDVGKIRVPDAVLHKPGPLDHDEYEIIRCHSAWGSETLSAIPGLEAVATVVRFHHERWDGNGYPDRLAGARIPLASRIICACDAFAAMTADRPYRDAMESDDALREVYSKSGTQFDPAVVDALAEVVADH
ncbi:MAG: HD domain-containing protein [Actinomycetota bacterium]|nr:HD domain-containing protein [Actinomycetota bacterium]